VRRLVVATRQGNQKVCNLRVNVTLLARGPARRLPFRGMGDISPRPSGPPSRRGREQRAYRLVLAGAAAGAVAVVSFVLAIAGVLGFGVPFIAAIVAVVCTLLFRRTVSR
jgi:hypothetical protein